MAIHRQGNWLPQQRLDIPHLRAIESAVVYDFDALIGKVLVGGKSVVVRGFDLISDGVSVAEGLSLDVAGSAVIHPNGSETGSLFVVPKDAPVEPLTRSNPVVTGGFAANSYNYVSLDLRRGPDTSTSDTVKFLDPTTGEEFSRVVPLARTLSFHLYISTQEFYATPNRLPLWIVKTDSENRVVEVIDSRTMLFSLDQKEYPSLKDWMDQVMKRIWALSGGETWDGNTSDRDIKVAYGQPVLPENATNFYWELIDTPADPVLLKWSGIRIVFTNSTATENIVADETEGVPFPNNSCLFVDVSRDEDGAVIVPTVAPLQSVGTANRPGARFVLAWRKDSGAGPEIFIRDRQYEIGREVDVASEHTTGTVRLMKEALNPTSPAVVTDSMVGAPEGVPLLGSLGELEITVNSNAVEAAITGIGDKEDYSGYGVAGVVRSDTEEGPTPAGVLGRADGTYGTGVLGLGRGTSGAGVWGEMLDGDGPGVKGVGHSGPGVSGVGGGSSPGVEGVGGGLGSPGVKGTGARGGAGVEGFGGQDSYGVFGVGGGGEYAGVRGEGGGSGVGVDGYGGGSWPGVRGEGATGVQGRAVGGTGAGVVGLGDNAAVPGSIGVLGKGAGSSAGVVGEADPDGDGVGVHGKGSGSSPGIRGEGAVGVEGVTTSSGPGVRGVSESGDGVSGEGSTGVRGLGSQTGAYVAGGWVGVEAAGLTDTTEGTRGVALRLVRQSQPIFPPGLPDAYWYGSLYYDQDTNKLRVYTPSGWVDLH